MRVRAMSPSGDMTFGRGSANFLINTPQAVAQLCITRMRLWSGQWFLDLSEGTPYSSQILGKNTQSLYDNAITQRLLGTTGVVSLAVYQSNLDRSARNLSFSATINTLYGITNVSSNINIPA